MEILKNVILALHIIGTAGLLGGALVQLKASFAGTARILPLMVHSVWVMLATGLLLVGLQYPLGNDVNNMKITVKLAVLLGVLAIVLINRKRETLATWVIPAIAGLTTANILIATVWKSYS